MEGRTKRKEGNGRKDKKEGMEGRNGRIERKEGRKEWKDRKEGSRETWRTTKSAIRRWTAQSLETAGRPNRTNAVRALEDGFGQSRKSSERTGALRRSEIIEMADSPELSEVRIPSDFESSW
jgi:hypothetical protein